jgi:hypothetical protein
MGPLGRSRALPSLKVLPAVSDKGTALSRVPPDGALRDVRLTIKIIGWTAACAKPFGSKQAKARRLNSAPLDVHHANTLKASRIPPNLRILEELRHIAMRLPGETQPRAPPQSS